MHSVVDETRMARNRAPALFAGTAVVVLGVVVNVVDFVQTRTMETPMPMAGFLGIAVWALNIPSMLTMKVEASTDWRVRSLDAGPLTSRHITLAVILIVAMIIDVMKPATLAFVAPGAAAEYHLAPRFVALWW